MKSKYNRLSRLNQIMLAVAATGALMSSVHATTYTWINVGPPSATYGGDSWNNVANNATNWSPGVPSNDGTADVVFTQAHQGWPAYTVNPSTLSPSSNNWSINSWTFNNAGTQTDWGNTYVWALNGSTTLSIGAGGITQNSMSSPYVGVPIIATASQTWAINNFSGNYTGGLYLSGNLTINNGVVITKANNSVANTLAPIPTGGNAWWNGALHLPTQVIFDGGVTTVVGSGAFGLTGGGFSFSHAAGYGNLGPNALQVTMDPAIRVDLNLSFNDNVSATFPTPITISGGYGSNLSINYGNGTPTAAGTTLTLTGNISGDMRGGWTNDRGFFNTNAGFGYCIDDRNRMIFQGNNGSLVSDHPTDWTYGILHIPSGAVVLDNANALGSGNSLSVFLGNNSTQTLNSFAGLLATSGNNVSSHVYVRNVSNGSNQHQTSSEIGLSGTGSVTFSGDFQMDTTSASISGGGVNGQGANLGRMRLTAPVGGQANFTGHFVDGYSGDPYMTPVIVLAGGTVQIAGNNAYRGKTLVRGGTLLVGGYNNALGQNTTAGAFTPTNVSLGDTVVAPAGGDVVAATTAPLPVSGFTAGVLTFSSAVSTVDGITLSTGNRVLVKDIGYNPERSGVYTVTDSTHWTRATDLNTASAFVTGLRVHVGYGTLNGGKNFYLPTGLWSTAVLGDTSGSNTNGLLVFNTDAPSDANVAILTNGALTISRNIDVTNNLSTGQSILGGNTSASSTFSGTIALSKDLAVQAATSGTVTFSGNITGSNNVVVQGSGLVKFSTAKGYTGTTTVNSGTLEVDNTLASTAVTVNGGTLTNAGTISGATSVGSGGTLQGTGTVSNTLSVTGTGIVSPGSAGAGTMTVGSGSAISGHLAVNVDDLTNTELLSSGTINVTGATVDFTVGGGGFTQPYYVIAQGSSITGTPSVTTGYQVTNTGTQLRLSLAPTNTYTNWMSTNYPSLTGSDALATSNPSHDGLSNLVKYALDLNPTVSTQPAGTHTGSSLSFTKGTMAKADGTLTYSIEESTDLVTWGAPTLGSATNGANTISYTFPSGQTKVFARLKVTQTP